MGLFFFFFLGFTLFGDHRTLGRRVGNWEARQARTKNNDAATLYA